MMRILVTGASSPLAVGVLRQLLLNNDVELWCGRHRKEVPIADPRLHVIDLDLESDLSGTLTGMHFDMVIHFAGVTHSSDEQQYWNVNSKGTVRLAEATRANGCRRFVYISTRCATHGSGAYGESKLAAEQELQKLDWQSLLIIRPAEIYGSGGKEGIDRMLAVAREWRIVPALFGHSNLLFAPMHVDDFSRLAADLIQQHHEGVRIETVCGPEDLSGTELASRIGKHILAVPLPLWWPAVAVGLKTLHKLGFAIVKPDQLARLIGEKTGTAATAKTSSDSVRRFPDNSSRPTANKRALKATLIILAWLLFLVLSVRVFRPDGIYVAFDSDGAIPVLMATEDRPVTVFDMYYWGVDRWGGWPLIPFRGVHQATGFEWTDYSLHVVRASWVFLGLLILVWMNRRAALAVLVSGLIVLCLEPTIRWHLFTLSQVYAWQLTALFCAWFSLRRVLVKPLLWSLSFYLSALLAIWSSEASIPYLFFLFVLEGFRSYFLHRAESPRKSKWARYVTALLLLAAATVSHALIKANYHRHGRKHWGGDFSAKVWVDVGYLWQNVQANWGNLLKFDFWPLVIISGAFLFVMTVVLLYSILIRKHRLRARLTHFALDDTLIMITALAGMALINFLLMICLSHVRLGFYAERYLTPTFFLGSIGGLMTIFLIVRLFADRLGFTRFVMPIAVVAAFVFLIVEFPHVQLSDNYKLDKETALILAQKAPGGFVMGGYWETYIFASLQPPATRMTPLPLEGLHVRIPWTPKMLRDGREVVIECRHNPVMNRGPLPAELTQYGNVLKLKDPQFYQNSKYSFALYVNEGK